MRYLHTLDPREIDELLRGYYPEDEEQTETDAQTL